MPVREKTTHVWCHLNLRAPKANFEKDACALLYTIGYLLARRSTPILFAFYIDMGEGGLTMSTHGFKTGVHFANIGVNPGHSELHSP